ncbi:MAG: helix-hairpin-helix domain-containing protein [Gammaproteobacteria bacterium]|nr:helix-hairpin-helix domain-containing protein [Gammaproteobacteria bacterium]
MTKIFTTIMAMLALLCSHVFAAPVNVNTATAEQIADALYGVGINKAQAIVDFRKQHGKFNTPAELSRVRGIGKGIITGNQGDIVVD